MSSLTRRTLHHDSFHRSVLFAPAET